MKTAYLLAAFAPLFKQQGRGHLVNVASLAGLVHPAGMSAYTASKAAVVAMSESLNHELAPWGVQVSVVCPSFFRTNLAASLTDGDPVMAAISAKLIERAPFDADQIAARVVDAVADKIMLVDSGWDALNTVIRPVLLVLTLPINLLTLGLFTFVINGLLFWLVARFVDGFSVTSFGWAIVAAIVYSLISWAVSALVMPRKD